MKIPSDPVTLEHFLYRVPASGEAYCMLGSWPQHGSHLHMHWMPSFSLMMPPSLASSTASSSAAAFFFRNFFSPLLSLLSVSAAAPASASVVFSNLLKAFSFTTCVATTRVWVSDRSDPYRRWLGYLCGVAKL